VTIGEVQSRIAHIQSMMTKAAGARSASAAPATATAAATGAPTAAPTSASQFAEALQRATATVDAARPPGASGAHVHPPAGAAHGHGHPPAGSTAVDPHRHPTPAPGWTAPAHGRVSSEFGPRWGTQHQGIDIAAGKGSTVTAAGPGVVRRASWYGGYGNAVVIDHGSGVSTLYGHNSELNVKPGDKVRAGQKIAEVGSTGDSTGPHLHFEVQINGKKVNPRPWLQQRGISL
jgi:murein DD-endopeptidase MepM/ murein hydrolase activator NlpD